MECLKKLLADEDKRVAVVGGTAFTIGCLALYCMVKKIQGNPERSNQEK